MYNADLMDEPIEFSENGTVQVPVRVGQTLVDEYDSIVPYDASNEADGADDEDDEDDEPSEDSEGE